MANEVEVTFDLMKHIGVIGQPARGDWTKEVNLVSWNGGDPKIDIRDWDSTHERMSRGITLTEDQAKRLFEALEEYFYGG